MDDGADGDLTRRHRSRSAIVVGAGIGGLAVARGLVRSGWRVTVYEQAAAFGAVGAGIAIEPNAIRAFDWIGLGPALRARGMRQVPAAGLRTARGRWLIRTELEELRKGFGAPAFLHRADVHDVLLTGLAGNPAVTLRTGHRATAVTSDSSDHASVTFECAGGPVTAKADLVVAADGMHSVIRSTLFPRHPRPAYAGYVKWRGIVPAEDASKITVDAAVVETWGRGRRVGVAPLPDGRIYWYFAESAPEGAQKDATVADLARRIRDWHAPIPYLLSVTSPQSLLRNDIYALLAPLPSYRIGRVVLLGDAAHAMTPDLGQGAALALEDAVTLAIHADPTAPDRDLDAGLDRYDGERRPRTQKLVRLCALASRIGQARNPLTVAVRNLAAGLVPTRAYSHLSASSGASSWAPPVRHAPGVGR